MIDSRRLIAVFGLAAALAFSAYLTGLIVIDVGKLGNFSAVAQLAGLARPTGLWGLAAIVFGAVVATAVQQPNLRFDRVFGFFAVLTLAAAAAAAAHSQGRHAASLALAMILGFAAVGLIPSRFSRLDRIPDRAWAWALFFVVVIPMCIFSMHRHWAFGSGSWDMGCEIHNAFRTSRFLPTTSTVLGEVDFLGDHFLVGFYLYAPVFWIDSSGYTVLLVQAVNLAVTAPAIFAIARHHGASREVAAALGLVTGLSYGLQSASFFDSHEITLGFGFLVVSVWAIEVRRYGAATLALFVFSLFKESVGPYVAALGLWTLVRGLRERDRRQAAFGGAWIIFGVVWFVLVNRVFMPALIARGNAPEPHETFQDFGPTVFAAAVGIVTQPVKAVLAIFIPDAKVESLAVTLANVGWLSVFSPSVLLAALPLIAERFLSSKVTMWQMGYHYAAPLAFYAGWAAARGLPRATSGLRLGLTELGVKPKAWTTSWVLIVLLLASGIVVTRYGYFAPANFYRWDYVYFSSPDKRRVNREAVAQLRRLDRSERLAVQNRILPHLADRRYIYRLQDHHRANWVLLSVGENAWPKDDGYPGRLLRELTRSGAWEETYAQGGTHVLRRKEPLRIEGP